MTRNKYGLKGITLKDKKWIAAIRVDYKLITLGRFDDMLDAAGAYITAAIEYHGDFARFV